MTAIGHQTVHRCNIHESFDFDESVPGLSRTIRLARVTVFFACRGAAPNSLRIKPTAIEQLGGMVVMLIVDPNGVEIEIIQD